MYVAAPGCLPARLVAATGVCLLIALGLPWRVSAEAPETEFVIRSWDRGDGVPPAVINQIQRAPNGYLWLATQRGLVRFDGEHFNSFNTENHPEFRTNRFNCVLADTTGGLWVGTGAGLFRQPAGRPGKEEWSEIGSHLAVKALDAGDGDVVWALTASNRVIEVTGGRLAASFTAPCERPLHLLVRDKQKELMVASPYDALLLREGHWLPLGRELIAGLRPDLACRCEAGGFWAAAGQEVVRLTEKDGQWAVSRFECTGEAPQSAITVVMEDHTGRLWAGTRQGAVHCLQPTEEPGGARLAWRQVTTKRLRSLGPVSCLYEDAEGLVWVGTTGGYLHQIKRRLVSTRSLPTITQESVPHTVCVARDGAVWIGTDGAGAYRYRDGSVSHFGVDQGLGNSTVIALFEDQQTNLWAGTFGGLYRLENGRFKPQLEAVVKGQPVPALFQDREGALWFGTTGAVLRKRGEAVDTFELGSTRPNLEVRAIAEGRRGQVWIGTRGGGLFRLSEGKMEHDRRFPHPRVHTMYADARGVLWVGTATRGLFRVAGNGIYNWTRADGLPSSWILSILDDGNGTLWLGSNEGVFGVSKQALMARARDKSAPLLTIQVASSEVESWSAGSGQPSAAKGPDGRLWFPAGYGVLSFDPAELLRPRPTLPVLIDAVLVDGVERAFDPLAPLRVFTGLKRLEFRYTIADLDSPGRLRFRYKLEGLDERWVDAGAQRSATYGPLAPGSYRFLVISAGSANAWTETAQPFSLRVVPHLWETVGFRAGAAALVLSLVGAAALFIGRAKLHRRLERLEMQSAMEKERQRIAQDLHDDLGSGISEIIFLSELARQEQANPATQNPLQLSDITQKARQIASAMDEIVWTVNPRNDSLPKLASYLCDYAREFLRAANAGCRIDLAENLPNVPLTAQRRHNLFMAVKEALNNAVKHSGATEVWLRIQWRADAAVLAVRVEDNGRGFDLTAAAEQETGNGLANMQSRLEALGGTTEFTSQPGSGTVVCFTLPLPAALVAAPPADPAGLG